MNNGSSSHKKLVLAVGAALSLAFVSFYLGAHRDPPPPRKVAASVSGLTKTLIAGVPRREIRPVPSTGPLPPLEAPLSQVIGELTRRANAGEAKAACRLAAEVSFCNQAEKRRIEAEQWLRNRQLALRLISSEANRKIAADRIASEMDARQERDSAFAAHCADAPLPSKNENLDNWRRAALLGNVAATRQYVSGNAFHWGDILATAGHLEAFKNESERLAKRRSAAGDLETMLVLADAYDPNAQGQRSLLAQAVKPDPTLALTIYLKAERDLASVSDPALAQLKERIHGRIEQMRDALPPGSVVTAESGSYGGVSSWAPVVVNGGTPDLLPGRVREMGPRTCEWEN